MAVRASLSGLLMAAATLIALPAAGPLYTLENATTAAQHEHRLGLMCRSMVPRVGCSWTDAWMD